MIANEQFVTTLTLMVDAGACSPKVAADALLNLARRLRDRADGERSDDWIAHPAELRAHAQWLSERAMQFLLTALAAQVSRGHRVQDRVWEAAS